MNAVRLEFMEALVALARESLPALEDVEKMFKQHEAVCPCGPVKHSLESIAAQKFAIQEFVHRLDTQNEKTARYMAVQSGDKTQSN